MRQKELIKMLRKLDAPQWVIAQIGKHDLSYAWFSSKDPHWMLWLADELCIDLKLRVRCALALARSVELESVSISLSTALNNSVAEWLDVQTSADQIRKRLELSKEQTELNNDVYWVSYVVAKSIETGNTHHVLSVLERYDTDRKVYKRVDGTRGEEMRLDEWTKSIERKRCEIIRNEIDFDVIKRALPNYPIKQAKRKGSKR